MISGLTGAVVAAIPVLVVLALMGLFRVKGYLAVLAGLASAGILAFLFWQNPGAVVLTTALRGAWKGLFPVVYVVATALVLYNLTVATGYAMKLRSAVELITHEQSLHLLLIGYAFAAFLDATAGFLTPIVVATAMLISLGVSPLLAASYTLIGSAVPAVFGAMGIAVVVLSEVADLPVGELSPALAVGTGVAGALMPVLLTGVFAGWRELKRLLLPVVATGLGYGVTLILAVTLVDYSVAAVTASLGAMVALGLTARVGPGRSGSPRHDGEFWTPWIPYILLVGALLLWGTPVVKGLLGTYLGSAGSAILVAALLFGLWTRAPLPTWRKAVAESWPPLKVTAVSICAVFAMAEIMKTSGMTSAMGEQVSRAGGLFPLLSPFIQWVASAVTGSNTTSIAMMGGLQAGTARALGLDPLRIAVFAGVAAAVGKMVAPQVLTAGAVAAGLPGQEGRLLKTGLRFSLAITLLLGFAGWLIS